MTFARSSVERLSLNRLGTLDKSSGCGCHSTEQDHPIDYGAFMKMLKPCLAEFLGTFFLCFAGIAAILSNTNVVGSGAGIVGIALAHGLALSVAVNAFGGISGAHFNPAVSVSMLITGRI